MDADAGLDSGLDDAETEGHSKQTPGAPTKKNRTNHTTPKKVKRKTPIKTPRTTTTSSVGPPWDPQITSAGPHWASHSLLLLSPCPRGMTVSAYSVSPGSLVTSPPPQGPGLSSADPSVKITSADAGGFLAKFSTTAAAFPPLVPPSTGPGSSARSTA